MTATGLVARLAGAFRRGPAFLRATAAAAAFGLTAGLAFAPALPATDAVADPVIERIRQSLRKNRELTVTFETDTTLPGILVLEGTVAGRPVRVKKRLKAGERETALRVDARKAKVRKLDGDLVFDLRATLYEPGSGLSVERIVRRTVPLPLVLLPGLGNEDNPGALDLFATALDNASGSGYGFGTTSPGIVVQEYESFSGDMAAHAALLDARVREVLRGTIFTRVDVVGYSMGGLVARSWMSGDGAGRVRKLVFLCTPNEGAPIAYLGASAAKAGQLDDLTGGVAGLPGGFDLGPFTDALADPESAEALRIFYPTYDWAVLQVFPGFTIPVDTDLLPDSDTPLEDLNAIAPDPECAYHAVYYTSLPGDLVGGDLGTVDEVDLSALLLSGLGSGFDFSGTDLTALASGDGDGVVPARSVTMDHTPAWARVIEAHDLGEGTHLTATIDPRVVTRILAILRE